MRSSELWELFCYVITTVDIMTSPYKDAPLSVKINMHSGKKVLPCLDYFIVVKYLVYLPKKLYSFYFYGGIKSTQSH